MKDEFSPANLEGIKLPKGGGQGFLQLRCLDPDCDVITFQAWVNDLDSPSEQLCPFCSEPGERLSSSTKITKGT